MHTIELVVLRILRFEYLANLAENAYLCPKIDVFGCFRPLSIVDHYRDTQKPLPCLKLRHMSHHSLKSGVILVIFAVGDDKKKWKRRYKNHKIFIFSVFA